MSSFAIVIIMYKVNESWESYFINILHKFFTIYPGTMWGGFDAPCSLFLLKYNIYIFGHIRSLYLRWVSLFPSTWFSWYPVITLSSGYALLWFNIYVINSYIVTLISLTEHQLVSQVSCTTSTSIVSLFIDTFCRLCNLQHTLPCHFRLWWLLQRNACPMQEVTLDWRQEAGG